MPVLWLCGPPGVGKSTVSWLLFVELAQAGVPSAFADADQLCMCYPAPAGDQGRQHLKTLNVDALIPGYRAAGARCIIVNGVIDDADGLRTDLIPQAEVLICSLGARLDDVVGRLIDRRGPVEDADRLRADLAEEVATMNESPFADARVDSTGLSARDVADLVRQACRQWPGFSTKLLGPAAAAARPAPVETARVSAAAHVLLVCGPTGVGKSTIGFGFYVQCLQAGLTAGYVDLDQIGFVGGPNGGRADQHVLKARNLAAMWRNYQGAGATHLVAVGPVESHQALSAYRRELPGATITLCRLRAGEAELARRIMSRGAGGSWPQPGDPLLGQPHAALIDVARQAARNSATLDRAQLGDLVIDTDSLTPDEAADLVGRRMRWY